MTEKIQPNQGEDVLCTVAAAMRSISSVQQRLVSNLNPPAICIEIFSGSPSDFPMFKQRFEKRILSRDEAKEAVRSFEAVDDGVYEAMRVLEARYGRKCQVVSSILDGFTKGPPITGKDRIALRNFADKVVSAATTLKSLNCLNEVNQGNLSEMSRRLPRYLQERFAVIAHDLETKEQRFPTLVDFGTFLERWENVANHPMK